MDEHAKHIILGFAGLVFVWFVLGGPQRELAREGVYLHPLAPIDSGTAYGGKYLTAPTDSADTKLVLPKNAIDVKKIEGQISDFSKQIKEVQNEHDISYLSKNLIIDGKGGATATDKNQEYVRLLATGKSSTNISISGLTLKSSISGLSGVIPLGVLVPIVGQVSEDRPIVLSTGDRAIVVTGESPIGSSFKMNMCSGYLEQFQDYTPTLRLECPLSTDELKNSSASGDSSCADFVASVPKCSAYTGNIPSNLSNACKSFITKNLTYNGCVASHRSDTNFFNNEWRIFLGKSSELWKEKQEIIRLVDGQGNTVDAITY